MLCKRRQFDCLLLASWSWWRVGHVETCKCNEPPPDICLRPFLHRDKPANYEHLALIWKISRKYLENISRYSVNARPISCAVAKTWLCIWLCSHQILFYKICLPQKWLYHQHLVLERSKMKRECPQHDYRSLFVQALSRPGKTQVWSKVNWPDSQCEQCGKRK